MCAENNHTINTSGTYIRFTTGNKYYNFTSGFENCSYCLADLETSKDLKSKIKLTGTESSNLLMFGYSDLIDKWKYVCMRHLDEVCVKQQHCNVCNKRSVVREIPRICKGCADVIIRTTADMNTVCSYPDVDQSDCMCTYCKKRLGIKV